MTMIIDKQQQQRFTSSLFIFLLLLLLFMCLGGGGASPTNRQPQQQEQQETSNSMSVPIRMPTVYRVLGPFPIGNREIGSDVLESFGSIESIWKNWMKMMTMAVDDKKESDSYPSELGDGGRVKWKRLEASKRTFDEEVGWEDEIEISYNETDGVRWKMMTEPYGLAGALFYSWIYASFHVKVEGRVLVNCGSCALFTIDEKWDFMGDLYGLGYGWNVVQLSKGDHTIRIKKSAIQSATIHLQFRNLTNPQYFVKWDSVVPSRDKQGHSYGDYLSIPILNTGDSVLQGFKVSIVNEKKDAKPASFVTSPVIQPGQTVLLPIRADLSDSSSILVNINTEKGLIEPISHNLTLVDVDTYQPFTYTFVDLDKTVQYAVAVPPKKSCKSMHKSKCPIIVATHGAGSRAEWLIGYYGQFDHAWIIAPSGRRRYGYDWTGPQINNAYSAVKALEASLSSKQLQDKPPNTDRLFFSGHSMGGHGCFLISTMNPDLALGSMCVSGWTTHHQYIPYFTRNDISFTDAVLKGLLESSIYEHNPDLHMENMKGVPLMTRTGAIDDNVSPWHPRRMARIHAQISGNMSDSIVSEIPGVGHWWDSILNDKDTRNFMNQYLGNESSIKPELPSTFTITCMNPHGFGGKGGILPLQLTIPFRIGKIRVSRFSNEWYLKTSNIRRFGIKEVEGYELPTTIRIDQSDPIPVTPNLYPSIHFCKEDSTGKWKTCEGVTWTFYERNPDNYGPMRIVFEKFTVIIVGTLGSAEEATWYEKQAILLSNQLYIVGKHYVPIIKDSDFVTSEYSESDSNLLLIGGPHTNLVSQYFAKYFPVRFHGNRSQISLGDYVFNSRHNMIEPEDPLGCIFLAALPNIASPGPASHLSRLALVIAGTSLEGVNLAARMIPVASGLHIPDYLIVTKDIKSKGSGGIIAAGYWNNFWGFDLTSAYVDELHSLSSPTNIVVPPVPPGKPSNGRLVSSLVTIAMLLGFSFCGLCCLFICQPVRKKPLLLDEPVSFTIGPEMDLIDSPMFPTDHDMSISENSLGVRVPTRNLFISPMSLSPVEEDSEEDVFEDTHSHRPNVTGGSGAKMPPPPLTEIVSDNAIP